MKGKECALTERGKGKRLIREQKKEGNMMQTVNKNVRVHRKEEREKVMRTLGTTNPQHHLYTCMVSTLWAALVIEVRSSAPVACPK